MRFRLHVVAALCGCLTACSTVTDRAVLVAIAHYAEVQVGMTREQVVRMAGAPSVDDGKGNVRWEAVSARTGRGARLDVVFDAANVARDVQRAERVPTVSDAPPSLERRSVRTAARPEDVVETYGPGEWRAAVWTRSVD